MQNFSRSPISKLFACIAIAFTAGVMSCDTFENDAITGPEEVKVSDKQFYTLPNSSTVIDLKSVVKAYSNVTLTINDEPDHGNLTKIGESIFNYRPHSNFTKGRDSFGIEISKGGTVILTDSIVIIVDSDTTQFPCTLVAVEDSVIYNNNPNPGSNATRVWVLENDRLCGVAKEDVVITLISGPAHGIAQVQSPQHILYEADAFYAGYDQLVYRISSPSDSTSFSYGLVNIVVSNESCIPQAVGDFFTANFDDVLKELPLLTNDTFCSQGGLKTTFSIVSPPKGSATVLTNSGIRYTPPSTGVHEADTLVYQVCFLGECSQATVVIDITYDGCTVLAHDDFAVLSDTSSLRNAIVFPLDNDEMCGYQESLEIVKQPNHGLAWIFGTRLDYTAESDTSPSDTVRYKVCNSHGCSEADFIIQRE